MNRPDNFEFAMNFIGGEEEESVRAYVERLERQRDDLLAVLKEADRLYSTNGLVANAPDMAAGKWINSAREAIASIDRPAPPAPVADADGWIEWKGGECPVAPERFVEVRFSSLHRQVSHAGYFVWEHRNWSWDIIAYRFVPEGGAA